MAAKKKNNAMQIFCIGTADTKLEEIRFLAHSFTPCSFSVFSFRKFELVVKVVDVSAGQKGVESCEDFNFVSKRDILSCCAEVGEHGNQLPDDRGKAIATMNKALQAFLSKAHADRVLAGVIGLGGSGGTSLISSAFRSLPLGIPKLIVSTVASGQTEPYVGTSDLVLFPSVVDICGINSLSRVVLYNAAAAALAGMVIGHLDSKTSAAIATQKGTVGLTMFGVTTPCINAVTDRLAREGHETLVSHAMGVGGRAMEDLVKGRFIQGVLDITTTEVADYIVGGVMACEASRFDAIIEKKIPLVLSAGALDMVNFGSKDTIPSEFQQRRIYEPNAQLFTKNLLERDGLSNEDTDVICKSEGLQCFHLGGRKRSRGKEKIGKPYNWFDTPLLREPFLKIFLKIQSNMETRTRTRSFLCKIGSAIYSWNKDIIYPKKEDLKGLLDELSMGKKPGDYIHSMDKAGTREIFLQDLLHRLAKMDDFDSKYNKHTEYIFLGKLIIQTKCARGGPVLGHYSITPQLVYGCHLQGGNSFEDALDQMWRGLDAKCKRCRKKHREIAKIALPGKYMAFVNDKFLENFTPQMTLDLSRFADTGVFGEYLVQNDDHTVTLVEEGGIFENGHTPTLLFYSREGLQWCCYQIRDLKAI
ncbi:hypothetical protein OROMI_014490 [Orobanche minor]